MDGERCDGCRFWFCELSLDADGRWRPAHLKGESLAPSEYEERPGAEAAGVCRRYPPTADWFPHTHTFEWCGEYQPRKPLPVVG